MENNSTQAGHDYAAAYAEHYTTKDIYKAFTLYRSLITAHPDTMEAGYSQAQIQNIVNSLVPKQKIMDTLVELAVNQFQKDDKLNAE